MSKITAKRLHRLNGWTGEAYLYELSAPVDYGNAATQFVVVSGVNAMFTGPETYIFAADGQGEVLSWSEMEGSFRGAIDHSRAVREAGWEEL